MGSKGSKPRKPKHSQHLAKVGTPAENERLLHEERKAVLSQMGAGEGSSSVTKIIVTAVITIVVLGAIIGLISLTVFR